MSSSSVRSGSVVIPAWTGDGWTTVLRGAVNIPNRCASPSFSRACPTGSRLGSDDGVGGGAYGFEIDLGGQRPEPYVIHRHGGPEKVVLLAVEDDPDIDEFASIDAWHSS